jgi:hypothetical protein
MEDASLVRCGIGEKLAPPSGSSYIGNTQASDEIDDSFVKGNDGSTIAWIEQAGTFILTFQHLMFII